MVTRPAIAKSDLRPARVLAVGFVLTTLLLTACGGGSAPSADSGASEKPAALNGAVRNPPMHVGEVTVPEVTVGRPPSMFTMKAEPGELLVVYFGYTNCPDLCPTTMAALRRAYSKLGEDASRIDTAMLTVDPSRDTPEVLTKYLSSFLERFRALRIDDGVALRDAQAPFAASSSIRGRLDGTYEISHVASAFVVNSDGDVVVEWPFGLGPQEMEEDLRTLLADTI